MKRERDANHENVWLRRIPFLACLVVLAIGTVYSSQLGRTKRFQDESDYVRCGYNLYTTGSYSKNGVRPTAYRPPGYPVLLGAIYQYDWGRNGIALRLANYLALCGTILLGAGFLRRRGFPRAAALAAVLGALYPPFLYTASTLYPQTLGALLLAWILYLVPREGPLSAARGAAIGLVAAALALTIPTFLAGIGLLLLWLLRRGGSRALVGVLTAGLALVLCVGSWTYRNYLAFDAFVPISTNAGRNLLLGNSDGTTPTSGVNVDLSAFEEQAKGMDEVERDRFYRSAALEWIAADPLRWLRLYSLKVLNHFNVVNTYATDEEVGRFESIVLAIFFLPLLAIFLWRLMRVRRVPLWPTEDALLVVYVGMVFATALFFTRIRFRLPLDHLMIWIAAASVAGDRQGRTDAKTASASDQ